MTKEKTNVGELLLNELLKDTTDKVRAEAEKRLEELQASIEARVDGIHVELKDKISTLESYTTGAPLVVNVGTLQKPKKKVVHKSFDTIIKILKSTKRKEKNIMLVGGAGGGKTHLVGTVAEALKLPFYPMSVGLQTTKSDLLGFVNATGTYVRSIIREAYENGGVLLLDEFDSAHAGVVTILNSLLANGHCSFPDGVITKHKDFICLCACNTYGKGGNVDYVGRNRLDGATLDRFIVVDVDYDNKLEKILTSNEEWLAIINSVRKNAEKKGVKVIISPRASMDGADLLEAGFSYNEAIGMTILKGCDKDIKAKLLDGVAIPTGKAKDKPIQSSSTGSQSDIKFDYDIELNYDTMTWVRLSSSTESITLSSSPSMYIKIDESYSVYTDNETCWIKSHTTSGGLTKSSGYAIFFNNLKKLLDKNSKSIKGKQVRFTVIEGGKTTVYQTTGG